MKDANFLGGHLEEGCIVKKGTDIHLLLSFEQKLSISQMMI